MIISCGECATKYNVNSAFIGLEGRKVKCTSCKHVWNATLPEEEKEILRKELPKQNIEEVKDDVPKESHMNGGNVTPIEQKKPLSNFLPAIIDRQVPFWLRVAPISIFSLCLSVYLVFYSDNVMKFVPETAKIYQHFGIYNTQGVILQDISLHKLASEGEYFDILIKGKIVNRSMNDRHLPGLRLSVLDGSGKNIISNISNPDDSQLSPGEEFIINNKITNLNQKAQYLAVDIGDRVELFLR